MKKNLTKVLEVKRKILAPPVLNF